jgi:hypothetical protein
MRHVVAALVSGRALASNHRFAEAPAVEDAPATASPPPRGMRWWAWLVALWKAAHPGS